MTISKTPKVRLAASRRPPGASESLPVPTAAGGPQLTIGIVVASLGAGYLFAYILVPAVGSQMLPWVLGRALGISAMVDLWALVMLGLWFRHPWAERQRYLHPAFQIRLHRALSVSGFILLAMHIASMVLDKYANVGLVGALVPGMSAYRTYGVALGTIALYLGIAIGASAALAGTLVGRSWLGVHKLALAMFASVWLHGLLSGTDAAALRPLYAALALAIGVLWFSKSFVRSPVDA